MIFKSIEKITFLILVVACLLLLNGCENSSQNEEILKRIKALEIQSTIVADKRAIHDVLIRYAGALDWLDEKRLDRVFFDDAEIDYGFFKGSGKDFKPVLMEIERNLGRRWHQTTQISINLDGDTAETKSYGIAFASADAVADADSEVGLYVGYYQDRFEKRDGYWGIAYRKYVLVSEVMLQETVLDGDLSVMHQIDTADLDSAFSFSASSSSSSSSTL